MRSVVFLTPLLLLALSAVAESPYKIGVLAPLTGDMQIFGQKAIEGVQLALDGYPGGVSYVVENVGTGATVEVAKGTTKLLSVDKVDVVFGAFFLDQTMVAAPLTEQAGRVLVSQTLCSPELVRFKRVFCGYPSTAEQLASFGKLVAKLKLKSAALVVENSSYGLDTERETRRIFSDQGVAVSYYQTVNPQDRDFKTVIAKLKRSKPDAVVAVAADPAQGFTFFKQLQEQGYQGVRIGYLDIDPKYLTEFGGSIEGVYLPGFITNRYPAKFIEAFKTRFGREPDMYGALAYDISRIIAAALLKGQGDLVQSLSSYPSDDTVVKNFRFREDRTVSVPVEVLQIRAGKYEVVELDK